MPETATTDGSTLPFPTAPSASTAGYTLAESTHHRRVEPRHLPEDAPNILIVLLDDVGFGLSDVVGGEVRTPAFRRAAESGICYNTFHTTSICSPTRAALMTGRNHHRERPQIAASRSRYVLYPGTQSITAASAPKILNRPYSINAEVELTEGTVGVLLSMGGNDGGITFYIKDGLLCYAHNYVAKEVFTVRSAERVPTGRHFLSVEFAPTGQPDIKNGKGTPGTVTLFVDGTEIGRGEFPVTPPIRLAQGGAMLVGADTGSSVTPEYDPPFRFDGRIHRVIVDVSGEHVEDYEAQMRIALAKQ